MKKLLAALLAALLVVGVTASSASSAAENKPVVIANGWSPSDVGTAAPLAASLGGSVLYANTDSLGDPTVDALKKLKPPTVVLVGGTKVLSADIETELGQVVPTAAVDRLAGTDRIHTAALAALYTPGTAPTPADLPNTASVGPGNAQEHRDGVVEQSFVVGTDLRPGVWEGFVDSGPDSLGCRFDNDGTWVERSISVNGEHQWAANKNYPYRRQFGLLDGDTVILSTTPGDYCAIRWVRE